MTTQQLSVFYWMLCKRLKTRSICSKRISGGFIIEILPWIIILASESSMTLNTFSADSLRTSIKCSTRSNWDRGGPHGPIPITNTPGATRTCKQWLKVKVVYEVKQCLTYSHSPRNMVSNVHLTDWAYYLYSICTKTAPGKATHYQETKLWKVTLFFIYKGYGDCFLKNK